MFKTAFERRVIKKVAIIVSYERTGFCFHTLGILTKMSEDYFLKMKRLLSEYQLFKGMLCFIFKSRTRVSFLFFFFFFLVTVETAILKRVTFRFVLPVFIQKTGNFLLYQNLGGGCLNIVKSSTIVPVFNGLLTAQVFIKHAYSVISSHTFMPALHIRKRTMILTLLKRT